MNHYKSKANKISQHSNFLNVYMYTYLVYASKNMGAIAVWASAQCKRVKNSVFGCSVTQKIVYPRDSVARRTHLECAWPGFQLGQATVPKYKTKQSKKTSRVVRISEGGGEWSSGYTWLFPGIIPGSVCRDHSWQCWVLSV